MIQWIGARLREKSTWLGLILIGGAVAAGPLGFAYADVKDAALVLFGAAAVGGGLVVKQDGE